MGTSNIAEVRPLKSGLKACLLGLILGFFSVKATLVPQYGFNAATVAGSVTMGIV